MLIGAPSLFRQLTQSLEVSLQYTTVPESHFYICRILQYYHLSNLIPNSSPSPTFGMVALQNGGPTPYKVNARLVLTGLLYQYHWWLTDRMTKTLSCSQCCEGSVWRWAIRQERKRFDSIQCHKRVDLIQFDWIHCSIDSPHQRFRSWSCWTSPPKSWPAGRHCNRAANCLCRSK